MSDFKVGDEAWFWYCDDLFGDFDLDSVQLLVNKIENEHDLLRRYLDRAYKSKQEAIDAFKKRLDEL